MAGIPVPSRPFSLKEVAEIVAFDVDNECKLNYEKRIAEPEDVLITCSSLVISIDTDGDDDKEGNKENTNAATSASETNVPMVRLAHLSVKEYLVSGRMSTGSATFFSVDEKVSNAVIGKTYLSCLQLYNEASFSDSKEFSKEFALAKYSAKYRNKHLLAKSGKTHPPPRTSGNRAFLV